MSEAETIAIRTPPTRDIFKQHVPQQKGKCRWCGLPILNTDGTVNLRTWWHGDCLHAFKIIADPGYARRVVFDRDHGICAECGADYSQMSMFKPERTAGTIYTRTASDWLHQKFVGPFSRLRVISLWHVDHNTPLWKVVTLEPLKRLWFFTLENMVTLCEVCHKRKSAKEEAEKAHFDAMEKIRNGTAKEKISRFGSRPFQKRESQWPKGRKMQSGPMRRKKKEEDDDEADRES